MIFFRRLIIICLGIVSLVGYGYVVFASPFAPGQTLDPVLDFPSDCTGPADVTCIIQQAWEQNLTSNYITTVGNSVGIGTATPHAGALLDLTSTTQGMLMPRMTTVERDAIVSPASGLIIYNTDSRSFDYFDHLPFPGSWRQMSESVLFLDNATNTYYTSGAEGQGNPFSISQNIFFGVDAGKNNVTASGSIFFGTSAGHDSSQIQDSILIGKNSGYGSGSDIQDSVFVGSGAGAGSFRNQQSNFIGFTAGAGAGIGGSAHADHSNFIGSAAGYEAYESDDANFLGRNAGYQAVNADHSNFFGRNAGYQASSAQNALFIGQNAGTNDNVNNVNDGGNPFSDCIDTPTSVCWSVLIGPFTNTGGFSNSILLGGSSDSSTPIANTQNYQFMLADTITNVRWRGVEYELPTTQATGTATYLYNDTNGVLSWEDPAITPSDERLKSNITDLDTNVLEKINQVRTVSYTLNSDSTNRTQIGFIAQDLENYFPDLVGTKSDGYKGVYYAQMTPVLVQAIRELDLKIESIQSSAQSVVISSGFSLDGLKDWLGDISNGIAKIVAGEITTDKLCIGNTCITESDLDEFKQWQSQQNNQEEEVLDEDGNNNEPQDNSPVIIEENLEEVDNEEPLLEENNQELDQENIPDEILPDSSQSEEIINEPVSE